MGSDIPETELHDRISGEKTSNRKKTYGPEFKTKVVLELLPGERTLEQVAGKYGITATTPKSWKRKFLENASTAFDSGRATKAYKNEIADLENESDALAKKLGKTTVEGDWPVGKPRGLGSSTKKDPVDSKPSNSSISVTRQCVLLGLDHVSPYYKPKPTGEADPKSMSRIDDIFANISSTYGYRLMHRQLRFHSALGYQKPTNVYRQGLDRAA